MLFATIKICVVTFSKIFLGTIKLSGKQEEWELVAMKAEFWLGERRPSLWELTSTH